MNEISVTENKIYDKAEIIESIRRHFKLLSLNEKIKPKMNVLIKPNLLMKRKPEDATTAHPLIVGGIIACLQELGVKNITIADSPGGPYTNAALQGIYQTTGMKEIAEEYNIKLNYDTESFETASNNGVLVKTFTLINPVKSADFIINVVKLKTHAMTTLSGAVKNMFGTVPGLMKPEFHWRFPEKENFCDMLLDLCSTVNPNVTFVDAIVAMEGDGPSGGIPKHTDMIISSVNPYNLDLALCKVMGINKNSVLTVNKAIARGLSVNDSSKLKFVGDKLICFTDFKMPKAKNFDFYDAIPTFIAKPLRPVLDYVLSSKPIIVKNKCIGCGKCAESCPAHTIQVADKKAMIDYSKCIKCCCCHEMCPVKAIEIKRLKLFDF